MIFYVHCQRWDEEYDTETVDLYIYIYIGFNKTYYISYMFT